MPRMFHALLVLPALLTACARQPVPPERVTHEERALAKASAAWATVYTQRADETFSSGNIQRFSPYTATLHDGVWLVRGVAAADVHGRMPAARVSASDGTTTVETIER
jgi:hypothetical protein